MTIFRSAPEISVPAQLLVARIDMVLDAELSSHGFEKIRPRRWVESKHPPIRRLFEYQALKGEAYSARWGFSLDYVPILRAGKLRWKRSAKTAAFDLCIDPIDHEGGPHDWYRLSRSAFSARDCDWNEIMRTVKKATKAAKSDFKRVESTEGILTIFCERSEMKFKRFSLENYVQTHIAWGLSLLAVGARDEGERHLETYCARFSVNRNDRILREAEQEAIKPASEY